jgi:hypothetical protein
VRGDALAQIMREGKDLRYYINAMPNFPIQAERSLFKLEHMRRIFTELSTRFVQRGRGKR